MNKVGITGGYLKWFRNYLEGRNPVTVNNSMTSDVCDVVSGVAQGSVCGPTMFLIFVNDLVNLCLNSSTLLFADDTIIYLHGKNTNELLTKVQEDLNLIEKWCTFNKLSLNVKQTKAMFFGNSFRRDSNPQFTLTLNGGLIDFADDYEYRGVKLDPRLHFDKHMSKVKRNVGEKLHAFTVT